MPAIPATNRLPARSNRALRPRRAAKSCDLTRPSVIAARVGAKRAPSTAMAISAVSTTGQIGLRSITTALRASNTTPADQFALPPRGVDQRPHWRMEGNAEKAADRQHPADHRLIPVRLG